MAVELVFAPEVEVDIAEAYLWYERRRPGLGEEFLSAVESCPATIGRWPASGPIVHETYRRSLVRRFPYAVFYEATETQITVTRYSIRPAIRTSGASDYCKSPLRHGGTRMTQNSIHPCVSVA